MDDSVEVEVCWDHDSPTPSAWKQLQGPRKNDESLQCSPKLAKPRRRYPPPSYQFADKDPRFQESRKEVDQIIDALRRASRENESSQVNIERRLVIPEMPEQEESDDDRISNSVPFRTGQQNSSLDVIFNMSGNGENLPSTMSSNAVSKGDSSGGDAWADDDDIFNDEALMSQVDNVTNKPTQVVPVGSVRVTARITSTPSNGVAKGIFCSSTNNHSARDSRNPAKGFLNFFMDGKKPPKPSPGKDKPNCVLHKRNNYKFVPKKQSFRSILCERSRIQTNDTSVTEQTHSTVIPAPVGCRNANLTARNELKNNREPANNETSASKPADTSIPMEVLEELITEDSWVDTEDESEIRPTGKESWTKKDKSLVLKNAHCNTIVNSRTEFNHTSASHYKFKAAGDSSTNKMTISSRANTVSKQVSCAATVPSINTKLKNHNILNCQNLESDGFSSEDEDMLLEAVALTESQQSKKDQSPATGKSTTALAAASKPCEENPNFTTGHSYPPKCSLSEIEKKKRLAIERRTQRMKRKLL